MISSAHTMFDRALILDFESVPEGAVYHIGAVLSGRRFEQKNIKDQRAALEALSEFAVGAECVLGHNVIRHDLAIAETILPEAGFLTLPVIDTLYLSPLAFPENPYHKLIKDYKLVKDTQNDPLSDARLAWTIFEDQVAALRALNRQEPDLIRFFSFCFEKMDQGAGIADLFLRLGGPVPDSGQAREIAEKICQGKVCSWALDEVWDGCCDRLTRRPMLAYVLSWLRVCGSNSIIPPWVRHEFPEIRGMVGKLRNGCGSDRCEFCREQNDPEKLLKEYFGFDRYRALADGRVLQKEIVEASLSGKSLLGILPTGGGKSICYQVPALHRFHRTGSLTIVISPLKALMKDQVDNLNRTTGTDTSSAINGSLTLPERGAVMEKVRLGDVGILYISPEQLRNFTVAKLILSRDVGCWVFDEAHCLSKWGHDFRPDYLHVADFIGEYSRKTGTFPLVAAFTATAKKDVIQEILAHFDEKLLLNLESFIGGVQRENLRFQVWPVTQNEKYDVIFNTLRDGIAGSGGAIVYCAKQKTTERISDFLNEKGIASQAFHGGRSEPDKRNIQDDFVAGKVPVICATNAFGMGIDKKDIRLVIHADIPGSLENYLQEAGRAGRDLEESDCILLYEQEDIEDQFSLNAYSKLALKDIKKILGVLRKKGARAPEIVITPGEIMRLIGYKDIGANDSRAGTGISWLERKGFLNRTFNRTLFFTGTPMVKSMEEGQEKIRSLKLSRMLEAVYGCILHTLFNADRNAPLSVDTICAELGGIEDLPEEYLDSRAVISLLSRMARAGLIKEGVVMTAFVRPKGQGSSPGKLTWFIDLEKSMLEEMEILAPDSWTEPDTPDLFNLRHMSQRLMDKGFDRVNADIVENVVRALANDKGEGQGRSLKISGKRGGELQRVFVKFSWQEIRKRMELRHHGAGVCLETIIARLPEPTRRGQAEVLSEFFMADMIKAMQADVFLATYKGDARGLIESCLLYMHDAKIITLQSGLGVFRQAFTLTLTQDARGRQYTRGDYEPLAHHYAQKNVQVHVMDRYARLGLEKIKTALGFVSDYFSASYEDFIKRHFAREKKIIQTAMTAEAHRKIVQSLENPIQEAIVATSLDRNILVLAGPGSGKTRTIVHRCAWLIKARSVLPSSILVLCFNHQAMIELRKRIRSLVGIRADTVTALTYHGFAMRLSGRSFLEDQGPGRYWAGQTAGLDFNSVIDEAVEILEGTRPVPGLDPAENRDYFLAQYRHILVDEYQDIDARQYRFISALTGRLEQEKDSRISIMAVGDDDQSIYGFRHANVKFIRQFKEDYRAKSFFLVENYRSGHGIIETANEFIAQNQDRMKTDRPCHINRKRKAQSLAPDRMARDDRVRLIRGKDIQSQAMFVVREIKKILAENPDLEPGDMAAVSRMGIGYPVLTAMRMALAREKVPFCYSIKSGSGFPLLKVREIQTLIQYLDHHRAESREPSVLKQGVMGQYGCSNIWTDQVARIMDAWIGINSEIPIRTDLALAFVMETLLEERREHKTGHGVFLGTVHSVKGMEFPHVFILDGGWKASDMEEERRLFYVGMTRAQKGLWVCSIQGSGNPHTASVAQNEFVLEGAALETSLPGFQENITVSILGMEDLYISYPGRFRKSHGIHSRLGNLHAGDRVWFRETAQNIFIKDKLEQTVGALSRRGREKWQGKTGTILNARVLCMVKRRRQDTEPQTGFEMHCDEWELPILELLHQRINYPGQP